MMEKPFRKTKKNVVIKKYIFQLVVVFLQFTTSISYGQWKTKTSGGSKGYHNAVSYKATGEVYSILQDVDNGNKATVQKSNGVSWDVVGSAGFSDFQVYSPNIAINQSNGDLYATYIESVSGVYKLSCKKFNGSNWVDVGLPGFIVTGGQGKPGITIDNSGNPVIVTPWGGNFSSGFYVYQFDGISWNNLTLNPPNATPATTPLDILYQQGDRGATILNNYFPLVNSSGDIIIAVSSPYIGNDGVIVMKYASGSWTQMGNNLPGGTRVRNQRVVNAPNGDIYVAYSQVSNSENICKVFVHKWNGSTWVDLTNSGTKIFNSTYNNFNSFSFDISFDSDNTPFVVYQNTGVDWRAYLKKYNASTSNWDLYRSGQVGGVFVEAGMRLFIDTANSNVPSFVATSSRSEPRLYIPNYEPIISSFNPSVITAGSTINIYGGNFSNASAVKFNNVNAASIDVVSDTYLKAVAPANTTAGNLSVTNSFGSTLSSSSYTVPVLPPTITSFSPTSAEVGDTVTINGTGFDATAANNVVYFGGIKAAVTSTSGTQIVVTVPPGANYSTISVLNISSGLYASSSNKFIVSKSGDQGELGRNFFDKFDITSSTNPSSVSSAAWNSAIHVGVPNDFNLDGKIDFAKVDNLQGAVKIFKNDISTTEFSVSDFTSSTFSVNSAPINIVSADLNNDGKPDLITTHSNTTVSILVNNSSLSTISFNALQTITFNSASIIEIADINNDGKLDVMSSTRGGSVLDVYLNNTVSGTNTILFDSPISITTTAAINDIEAADLDGDGDKDILLPGTYNGTGMVIIDNTSISGNFTYNIINIPNLSKTGFSISTADLNHDNKLDIVLGVTNGIVIFENAYSSGSLAASHFTNNFYFNSAGSNYVWQSAVSDFDGNGTLDIVTGDFNGGSAIRIIKNETLTSGPILSTNFDQTLFLTSADSYSGIFSVDFNNDGKGDYLGFSRSKIHIGRNIIGDPLDFFPRYSSSLDFHGRWFLDQGVWAQGGFGDAAFTFTNATFNLKGFPSGYSMNNPITISGKLKFYDGKFNIGATLYVQGDILDFSASNYVSMSYIGPTLKRDVPSGQVVEFPVGETTFNPVKITNNGSTLDSYSVAVIDDVANDGNSPSRSFSRSKNALQKLFLISKTNTNSSDSSTIEFNWNSDDLVTGILTNPALYFFDTTTSSWEKITTGVAVNGTTLTLTNYTEPLNTQKFAIADSEYGFATPTVNITENLNNFTKCINNQASVQFIEIEGIALDNDLILYPPRGFEISESENSGYTTSSLTLTRTNGNIFNKKVYVRLSYNSSGNFSGNLRYRSYPVDRSDISLSGSINASPTITMSSSIKEVLGATSFNIPFTSVTNSPDAYSVVTGSNAMPNFTAITDAAFTGNSGNLAVAIPAGSAPGAYDFNVTVKNTSGSCESQVYNITFTISDPAPTITSFSPTSAEVGDTVTITGTQFSSNTDENIVRLNGMKCTVTEATATQLKVTIPSGTGYGKLLVTNIATNKSVHSNNKFLTTASYSNELLTSSSFGENILLTNSFRSTSYNKSNSHLFGDFNDDGKMDIAYYEKNGTLNIYKNISTPGTLSSSSFVKESFSKAISGWYDSNGAMLTMDFNNDGKLDFALSNGGHSDGMVNINNSSPASLEFDNGYDIAPLGYNVNTLASYDVNGDGLFDLIGFYNSGYFLYNSVNTSSGDSFSMDSGNGSSSNYNSNDRNYPHLPLATVIFDADGDGLVDMLYGTNTTFYVYHNQTSFGSNQLNFNSAAVSIHTSAGDVKGIGSVDLNQDGKLDIVYSTSSNLKIYLNTSTNGSPSFSMQNSIAMNNSLDITFADLDGDGNVDIIASDNDGVKFIKNITTSLSTSTNFESPLIISTLDDLNDINVLDFDNDGKLDIIGNDNYSFYLIRNKVGEIPVITVTQSLSDFETCAGRTSSSQSFTVEGSNLTSDISISSNDNSYIEFSSDNTTFSNSLTINQSSGSIEETTVYTRLKANATAAASASKTITISSTGATSETFNVTRAVNASPSITLAAIDSGFLGATSFAIPYTSVSNAPDSYSLTTGTNALENFTEIVDEVFTGASGNLSITIPSNTVAGTYDFVLTVKNSSTSCISEVYNLTYTVKRPVPTITPFTTTNAVVGATFTLTGTGFDSSISNNIVLVSKTKAQILSASSTSIQFKIPKGTKGINTISVINLTNKQQVVSSTQLAITNSLTDRTLGSSTFSEPINLSGVNTNYNSFAQLGYTTNREALVYADLNNDSKPDLLVGGEDGTLHIFINSNSTPGQISASDFSNTAINVGNKTIASVVVEDFNNDGKIDFAVQNSDQNIFIYTNTTSDGTSTFSYDSTPLTISSGGFGLIAGDMNGDGLIDLLTHNGFSGQVKIFENSSPGTGVISFNTSAAHTFTKRMGSREFPKLADLNNDGKADIIFGGDSSPRLDIFMNTYSLGYTFNDLNVVTFSNRVRSIDITDIDRDGDLDVIASHGSSRLSVYSNNSGSIAATSYTGSSFSRTDYSSNNSDSDFTVADDLNGDGYPDILSENRLHQNDGNGVLNSLGYLSTVPTPSYPTAPITIDIDLDGKPDIVAGANGTGINIYRNTLSDPPTINVTSSLNTFESCEGISSSVQSFTISGNLLTTDITINAPSNYEISTSSSSNFSANLTLAQSNSVVSPKIIYVRLKDSTTGNLSQNISISSTGATTKTIAVSATVNAIPSLPIVSNVSYCVNETAISLTASATSGNTLNWYSAATGGTASTTAPIPVTTAAGTTIYYVSQQSNVTTCESDRVPIEVTVVSLPTVSDFTYCDGDVASPLEAIESVGYTLQWYTTATGGTASTTAPTPNISTVGTTRYYVSQKNDVTGCETPRASIVVKVNNLPTVPAVSDVSYCEGETASALTATALSGHTLQWYTAETGGIPSTTAPIPDSSTAGTTTYYVSQKEESELIEIKNSRGSLATSDYISSSGSVGQTFTVSDNFTLKQLVVRNYTFSGSVNITAKIYDSPSKTTLLGQGDSDYLESGGTANSPVFTFSNSNILLTAGSEYYFELTKTGSGSLRFYKGSAISGNRYLNGVLKSDDMYFELSGDSSSNPCESPRAAIVVTVNNIPTAPVVSDVSYCAGDTASALDATALAGHSLNWYTTATGGTASTTAPTPAISLAGTTTYYVSQMNDTTGCESNRATIDVTVKPTPVISGDTSVAAGEFVTFSATTTPATSNAWVSSSPTNATVDANGEVSGLVPGNTVITYTNINGCSVDYPITVTVGNTQEPLLTLPATDTTGATTLQVAYTLPEAPLSGSVSLTFSPTDGSMATVWTMTDATSATFNYEVGSDPTTITNVTSGAALSFTVYNVTISYQDVFSNPIASATNTNIQTLAPPAITSSQSDYNGVINVALTTISTTNSGGTIVSYAISPSLPSGLSFSSTTGVITGTPTVALAQTQFTITATNAAGSGTVNFNLFIDIDTDNDGEGDLTDDDIDGDGIPNDEDADVDGDGTNDNGEDTDG
ncbi:FG-GAP-like repeat-containing protein, partial [uncultured Polaribacter sp.]|uniref:FG-GAP-like repeat-containing protein n=1 Tax=uncultured Polaribacter sp. TaxID=174711 RepID=UPI00261240BA